LLVAILSKSKPKSFASQQWSASRFILKGLNFASSS